jgi:hypothetical protein
MRKIDLMSKLATSGDYKNLEKSGHFTPGRNTIVFKDLHSDNIFDKKLNKTIERESQILNFVIKLKKASKKN